MKKKRLVIMVVSILIFLLFHLTCAHDHSQGTKSKNNLVTIEKEDTHYKIVLDYRSNPNPYDVGKEYFLKLKQKIPHIERILDSYLSEMSYNNRKIYRIGLARGRRLRMNIPWQYRNEIRGMAAALSNPQSDVLNDGKLSLNELFALNLLPDIGRGTACSGISIWGSLSKNRRVITGRNLDWNPGSRGQLYKLNAITTILYGPHQKKRSIAMLGFCGMSSVITGFNDKGLFAGILDASTGQRYRLYKKNRSYVMDLRKALEESTSVSEISRYMTDKRKQYSFNHLILVSDVKQSKVIENYIFRRKRRARGSQSRLHHGVQWNQKDAICTVNSFLLRNNFNNHKYRPFNYKRFNAYKKLILRYKQKSPKGKLRVEDIKSMITFKKEGLDFFDSKIRSIFMTGGRSKTLQSCIFIPETKELYIYFRQGNSSWGKPSFKAIKIF